jgi:hypothetical protein
MSWQDPNIFDIVNSFWPIPWSRLFLPMAAPAQWLVSLVPGKKRSCPFFAKKQVFGHKFWKGTKVFFNAFGCIYSVFQCVSNVLVVYLKCIYSIVLCTLNVLIVYLWCISMYLKVLECSSLYLNVFLGYLTNYRQNDKFLTFWKCWWIRRSAVYRRLAICQ